MTVSVLVLEEQRDGFCRQTSSLLWRLPVIRVGKGGEYDMAPDPQTSGDILQLQLAPRSWKDSMPTEAIIAIALRGGNRGTWQGLAMQANKEWGATSAWMASSLNPISWLKTDDPHPQLIKKQHPSI